ncbi:hypothetical protein TKK_0018600 [Trichogramma kaykai]
MHDSLTLTLSGQSSVLESHYFPPIELDANKNYFLGLIELLTFNSIPNIETGCNRLYLENNKVISIQPGSYEIEDIENCIKTALSSESIEFSLKPNNNTLRSTLFCSRGIDFRPKDSIGRLLGFTSQVLEAGKEHISDLPVAILKVNALRVECNITSGAFINNQRVHTIHEFFPAVPPGFKIIEVPSNVIYLPVNIMGIVYGNSISSSNLYKSRARWHQSISRERPLEVTVTSPPPAQAPPPVITQRMQHPHQALSRQNIQFLKNLGLRPSGESPV